MRVSLVIPTKNALKYLPALFETFAAQLPSPPEEIIVMDSLSTDGTADWCRKQPRTRVIDESAFCHAETRNRGAAAASGDVVVFLSQDALPKGRDWLEALTAPFADPAVAATYSRQVPYPNASPMETFFLAYRFPDGPPHVRKLDPGQQPDFELAFFSNVSSAVRRSALLAHPLDGKLIMSEDQQLSRDLLLAGYAVIYTPASVVTHSHQYRLSEAFRRYFDSVYSLRQIYPSHGMGTSAGIGARYVLAELKFMIRRHPFWLPYYFLYTAAKALATFMAHRAERLPRRWVKRMSLHRYYWDRQE